MLMVYFLPSSLTDNFSYLLLNCFAISEDLLFILSLRLVARVVLNLSKMVANSIELSEFVQDVRKTVIRK